MPPMTADHIDRMHRVGPQKTSAPRSVMVKFATYGARHRVFSNRKQFRGPPSRPPEAPAVSPQPPEAADGQPDQPGQAPHVEGAGRAEPPLLISQQQQQELDSATIFVNEDLTKTRATLLWKARQHKRDRQIKNCWSFDGRVQVQNIHGRIIVVANQNDLDIAAAVVSRE